MRQTANFIAHFVIAAVLFSSLFAAEACVRSGFKVELSADGGNYPNTHDLTSQLFSDLISIKSDAQPRDSLKLQDTQRSEASTAKDSSTSDNGFVNIKAGTFLMGTPTSDPCFYIQETQHQVTLTHDFEVMNTEITQASFTTLMGYNPSSFASCGANCPVEMLSWNEAAAYCNELSKQKGLTSCYNCAGSKSAVVCDQAAAYLGSQIYHCPGFRLLTEAEWEYAYRAGTTTTLFNNTNVTKCYGSDANANAISWNGNNSNSTTHPVASTSSPNTQNAWGVFDMAGNVEEWTNDGFYEYPSTAVIDPVGDDSTSNRTFRGGAWNSSPITLRAVDRTGAAKTRRDDLIGARCGRSK